MADRLLDVKAVAARFSVTPWTIYRWSSLGLLTSVKVGGALRFRPADVEAFERRNERPARAAAAAGARG